MAHAVVTVRNQMKEQIEAMLLEAGVPMRWQGWARYALDRVLIEALSTGKPFPLGGEPPPGKTKKIPTQKPNKKEDPW